MIDKKEMYYRLRKHLDLKTLLFLNSLNDLMSRHHDKVLDNSKLSLTDYDSCFHNKYVTKMLI